VVFVEAVKAVGFAAGGVIADVGGLANEHFCFIALVRA
jgi:hypothetical protein